MKTAKILPIATVLACALVSCGKKDSDSEATAEAARKAQSKGDKDLALQGKLVLPNRGPNLALAGDMARGVILFSLDGAGRVQDLKDVKVEADGSFFVGIDRLSSEAEKMKKVLKPDGSADKALAKQAFPEHAAEIDGIDAKELGAHLKKEIEQSTRMGSMRYLIVSYEKSGDKAREAQSFQFVGLPTGAGPLRMLPAEALKGDTNLGDIKLGTGDEASASTKASDSIDLPAKVLEELAGASQTLKVLKNVWINGKSPKADITPWYGYMSDKFADAENAFVPPSSLKYMGGGFYNSVKDIGASFGEVCPANPADPSDVSGTPYAATPAKKVEFTPPQDLTTAAGVFGPANPYSNLGGSYTRMSQYGETSCGGENLYVRAKADGDKSFQLGMGGHYQGEPVKGLWKLKVDDKVVGQWDLAAARPFDKDGHPVIYIPSFRVTTEGGVAKRIEAKFFFFDKGTKAFREVTDAKGLMAVVHGIGFDVKSQNTSLGDQHLSDHGGGQVKFENGVVSAELKPELQLPYGCTGGVGCISGIGMSYHIGPVSYRLELRGSMVDYGSN